MQHCVSEMHCIKKGTDNQKKIVYQQDMIWSVLKAVSVSTTQPSK